MLIVTWNDFEQTIEKMKRYLDDRHIAPDIPIYGEPRGGLPIAVALSHATGRELEIHDCLPVIWVDDIIDTGETYLRKRRQIGVQDSIYMAWFVRYGFNHTLHFYADTAKPNEWILFPWESREAAERDRAEYNEKNHLQHQ